MFQNEYECTVRTFQWLSYPYQFVRFLDLWLLIELIPYKKKKKNGEKGRKEKRGRVIVVKNLMR